MLIRYSAKNFLSLREEQELSLVASSMNDRPAALVPLGGEKQRLLTVAAIYGANASGKTNVLSSLGFMKNTVEHSQRTWSPESKIPRRPFMLEQSERIPSRFVVEFTVRSMRYQYGFIVTSKAVLEEWLYAYPKGKQQLWFRRKHGKPFQFRRNIGGAKRTIESITRQNSLFLSAAVQNNLEAFLPIYDWFAKTLVFPRTDVNSLMRRCSDEQVRAIIRRYVGWADLGILDVQASEADTLDEEQRGALKQFLDAIYRLIPESKGSLDEKIRRLSLTHRGPNGSNVALDSTAESSGTLAFLSKLLPIVDALRMGGVLVIDELERSLHPILALRIIKLFANPVTNARNAQLIFSTHDTNLLQALRRDQVWFTEKDRDGATHLYSLNDFKPRSDENFERGYLQGRYGAIPFLGSDSLLRGRGTAKDLE